MDFNSLSFYKKGDVVSFKGKEYTATKPSGGIIPDNSSCWTLKENTQEIKKNTGIFLEYNNKTFYSKDDSVLYNNIPYRCITPSQGVIPTSVGWVKIEGPKKIKNINKYTSIPISNGPIISEPKEKIVVVEKIVEKIVKEIIRPPLNTFWIQ